MVKIYQENIIEALDEITPMTTIKVRSNYKFGLSETLTNLIKSRDRTLNNIKFARLACMLIQAVDILTV